MATTAAIISAAAATLGAGTGIASAAGAFGKPQAPKIPTPPPVDTTSTTKGLLPGAKANAAANLGGGAAPDFIASMLDRETGQVGGGLNILDEIRRSGFGG